MKKIGSFLLQALLIFTFASFMALLAIEWLVGCGEYYIDARGNLISNECVFINFPKGN